MWRIGPAAVLARALILVAALMALGLAAPSPSAVQPPQASVDVTFPKVSGRTIAVPAGADLQVALDRAQPGDVITLEPGATYTGPFTLPRKSGDDWIVIRTNATDEMLPQGRRVRPADAPRMPVLVGGSAPVLTTAPGAHHYRLVGLEIRPRERTFVKNLVDLGPGATSVDALPHHIVFDRCYLHGDKNVGGRRGIALNARDAAVIDSYLSDFKESGADSQAIAGWNGPGPFLILNDYLEAAGENVMFGGADPTIRDLVPSDIEVRQNHMAKPLAWKSGEPGFQGHWVVKNLFELKNARRVLVDGNLLENNWAQDQNGFAILFTVRNQDGRAPWSTVEDVTFVNNVLRHAGGAVNVHGQDDLHPSQVTRRIAIRNNLFEDIGGPRWSGRGTLFQIINGVGQLVIEHNTGIQAGSIIFAEGPRLHEGFVFRDNIAPHNEYGIIGTGTGSGNETIDRYFPGAVIEGNVIAGGSSARYPRGNAFPKSLEDVGFADPAHGDYRLARSSRYRAAAAAGGKPAGVDWDALGATRAERGEREPR